MFLKGGKEVKITRFQIWAVWRMFQVVYLKHCKELCLSCKVGPSVIVQNTCCNRTVQGVVVSWLLVTFLVLHSMALHWLLGSFPWNLQQYALAVPKHFASRFAFLEFFRSRGPMFPLPACSFCLREVTLNPRLVATENAFEEIMAMKGILLVEWVQTILLTCGLPIVFAEPLAHKPCGSLTK